MTDEIKNLLRQLCDEEENKCRGRVQCLEAKFMDDPESLTERDRLELIALMLRSPEIQSVQHFEALVTQLHFFNETIDPEDLKTAWKKFLILDSPCDSPSFPPEWDPKCDWVMARCFKELGKPTHSVSVCEYMLSQMIGGGPDYSDYAEECLFGLFEYYFESKLSRRAREILTLITTYYENGYISDDRYYAVLPKETELFYWEIGESVDRDRCFVEGRLKLLLGETFEKLHDTTRNYLVDAELWSNDRMRMLEPTAGPRRWALAVEAEFHHKVYEPHRSELASVLGRSPETCGPRDISDLIKHSSSRRLSGVVIRRVFEGLLGRGALASVANLDALEVISEHRNQIAHVKTLGPYTLNRCNAFMKEIRESEWGFNFLSSLQPIRAK